MSARAMGEPTEIYRYDVASHETRRLSSFNDAVAQEVDFRPA